MDYLPPPRAHSSEWLNIAAQCSIQWKALIKRLLSACIKDQEVRYQIGERRIEDDIAEPTAEPMRCPYVFFCFKPVSCFLADCQRGKICKYN